jgi:Uma2 family endonuclease
MNAPAVKIEPITIDAFLALLDRSPETERWELVDGFVVRMMAGGTGRHAVIWVNFASALRAAARKRGCWALPDMLLRHTEVDDTTVAPDVLVRCGPESKNLERVIDDPLVVVEVLSPSTMAYDRGVKFAFYQAIPSVAHIVLAYQDERRVEVFSRGAASDEGANEWSYAALTRPADVVALPALDFAMTVADVYDGVTLPEPGTPAAPAPATTTATTGGATA